MRRPMMMLTFHFFVPSSFCVNRPVLFPPPSGYLDIDTVTRGQGVVYPSAAAAIADNTTDTRSLGRRGLLLAKLLLLSQPLLLGLDHV
jgi:hypothetical protein